MLHNFHNCNTYPPSPFVLEYTQTIPLCELQILVFILVNLTKLDLFIFLIFKILSLECFGFLGAGLGIIMYFERSYLN